MSLTSVRDGLAAVLAGIPDVNVYGYMSLSPTTPAIVVGFPDSLDPNAYIGADGTNYLIDLALFVGLADDKSADVTLCGLVEEVLVALRDDPDLGGACSSALAVRVGDFGRAPLGDGGPEAFGCLVNVEIFS